MRLCALATAGQLTPEEQLRLEEHLSQCEECQEIYAQYEQVMLEVLPPIASEVAPDPEEAPGLDRWSLEDAERRLMDQVEKEAAANRSDSGGKQRKDKLLGTVLLIGSLAGGFAGYRIGVNHRLPATQTARSLPAPEHTVATIPPKPSLDRADPNEREELARLRGQVMRERLLNTDLENRLDEANDQLNQQAAAFTRVTADRDSALQELSTEHATLLETKLEAAEHQPAQDSAKLQELESQVTSLNQIVQAKDSTIADQTNLLAHDRDIRNLMGARNLYIAEIYDVAKNGTTQRPFGRVFYTRDKSLIFYGFDLDQQPHVKDSNVFQAWGKQDGSPDVNLGVLYLDDASKNRWALKVTDAQALARLDAVFITVEPKGGSTKPSGKPLLFTYLRIPPNHP